MHFGANGPGLGGPGSVPFLWARSIAAQVYVCPFQALRLIVSDKPFEVKDLQCDDVECGIIEKFRPKVGLGKIRFTRSTLT